MTSKTNINIQVPSSRDLKQVFENAVEVIQPPKKSSIRRHAPIVQRGAAIAMTSRIQIEKRAISEAAQALAQLWKIAPHPAR